MKSAWNRTLMMSMLGGLAVASAWAHDDKFRMMDSNGDGKITAAEHAAGVKLMFEKMDADHDGNVTAAEMDAGHKAMMHDEMAEHAGGKAKGGHESMENEAMEHEEMRHEMSSADKIKMMDTNGDGMLSAAEHDAGAAKMFSEMDTDHDGSLSRAEMAAGHKMMMKDHGMAHGTMGTHDDAGTQPPAQQPEEGKDK